MNGTLPLFQELEQAPVSRPDVPARRPRGSGRAATQAPPASAGTSAGGDRHLRAAWRLSRAMWRFPDRSVEQTRAGLAICHHLQALLADSDEAAGR